MPYTISIEGEELRRFEEDWPDDIPYRPVESIEFMYDSAGGFYCALAVTDKGNFALNTPHPISLEFKRALRLKAEQLWDEVTGVIEAEVTAHKQLRREGRFQRLRV